VTNREWTSPVTLHDVAREAGVSLATASRTLNGSERNVKESNRQLVLAAAERLGYTANTSAQAVARGTTTTVALLVGDIADPYFSSIAAGVVDAAAENGLIVTMAQTSRDTAREVELVRAMRGQRARAIVLAASRRTPDPHSQALHAELAAYEAAGGRAVFITATDAPFRAVPLDNHGGARDLGNRLHGLGYRNVAVLAGPGTNPASVAASDGLRTSGDRLAGFAEAFATAGSPIPAERVITFADLPLRSIGHKNLPRALAERGPFYSDLLSDICPDFAGTVVTPPSETVADRLQVDLGKRPLRVKAWPTAHTNNDLTVFDEKTGTLWTGDLIFAERLPTLDGSILGWLKVLDELLPEEVLRIVPGHGPVSDGRAALANERRYLEGLRDGVRQAIAEGLDIPATLERFGSDNPQDWQVFEHNHGRNIVSAYTELEWE